jgi:hypothetical protein
MAEGPERSKRGLKVADKENFVINCENNPLGKKSSATFGGWKDFNVEKK